MSQPDKTTFVIDTSISDPNNRTVTTYEITGSLTALRKMTIDVSREVELPAILAHLQRMWDSEIHQAQSAPPCTATGSIPSIA